MNNSQWTWGDLKEHLLKINTDFNIPYDEKEKASFLKEWCMKCTFCKEEFKRPICSIMRTKIKGVFCSEKCASLWSKNKARLDICKYSWNTVAEKIENSGNTLVLPEGIDLQDRASQTSVPEWFILCKCGNKWQPTLSDITRQNPHKSCGCVSTQAQIDLASFLKASVPDELVLENNRQIIKPLELDIYIPGRNIAIEYNGLYWHGEARNGRKARNKQYEKYLLCQKLGLRLISIHESEWINSNQKVKSYLSSILNKSDSIYARKCIVKDVPPTIAKAFCDAWHLQNGLNLPGIGLFDDKDELLAVAQFKKRGIDWELVRFCHKDRRIIGGCSKILKFFRQKHVGKVVSYSDNRWSQGGIYRACGFKKGNESLPSYGYFRSDKAGNAQDLKHRFGFRKDRLSILYPNEDQSQTEWEIMKKNGWDRIWDCGKIKWVLD